VAGELGDDVEALAFGDRGAERVAQHMRRAQRRWLIGGRGLAGDDLADRAGCERQSRLFSRARETDEEPCPLAGGAARALALVARQASSAATTGRARGTRRSRPRLECSTRSAHAVSSAGRLATASRSLASGHRGTSTTSSHVSAHSSERRSPARASTSRITRSRCPRVVASWDPCLPEAPPDPLEDLPSVRAPGQRGVTYRTYWIDSQYKGGSPEM
jgi:hypothetical protein